MADVFISYASGDRDRVRPLAEALQRRGFKVWWDRALAGGQDYAAVIERELKAAKAVVVVWTAGSVSSNFVRDEASRARDEGKLTPILLDRVEPPLGFGSIQAEDFTRWTGAGGAPQVQILDECLRAKMEGRDIDGAKIAHRRRRLMARVRIVSLLTVVFLLVGIAAGAKYFLHPQTQVAAQQQPADMRVQLLNLLEEGKLTPDQAIRLAEILQPEALAGAQQASATDAFSSTQSTAGAGPGQIGAAEFAHTAAAAYAETMPQLLRDPEPAVRRAAVEMADPAKRDAAIQTLWNYAQDHPGDRQTIYLACGAVGAANDNPLGAQALALAAETDPSKPATWAMLSYVYREQSRDRDAQAAALVGAGVAAQQAGDAAGAEQRFQEAVPQIDAAPVRAFVAAQLGQFAEARQDFTSASARYAMAYRASEQAAGAYSDDATNQALEANAHRLVSALDKSGRTRDACELLQRAQVDHDVSAPQGDLAARCQTRFHMQLRR
ncbi:MAG: toll/interleukin-1 receptor domain-containing protein [Pseudomonadota bacterium]